MKIANYVCAAAVATLFVSAATYNSTKTASVLSVQHDSILHKESPTEDTITSTFAEKKIYPEYTCNNTFYINLPKSLPVEGTINLYQEFVDGTVRFGGDFNRGTFACAVKDKKITGVVFTKTAVYQLQETDITNDLVFAPVSVNSLICANTPGDLEHQESLATTDSGTLSTESKTIVPTLNSRPEALTHLYLEFGGAKIQDIAWNGGKLIDAAASGFTQEKIQEVWRVVSERYSSFNINVTTDKNKYINTKYGYRQRVIITPTNSWYSSSCGGAALNSSVKYAGTNIYSPDVPCFVFTRAFNTTKNLAECVAHELGHTLGLTHDGASGSAYYAGNATWAPIMGTPYNKPVVQFSRGEYTGANNKQDDISIIVGNNKGISFATAPDIAPVPTNTNFFTQTIISNQNDFRVFAVRVNTAGVYTINAAPGLYSSVDTQLELIEFSTKKVIATNTLSKSQQSTISTNVTAGTYLIKLSSAADAAYPRYGSNGTVLLTGSLTNK